MSAGAQERDILVFQLHRHFIEFQADSPSNDQPVFVARNHLFANCLSILQIQGTLFRHRAARTGIRNRSAVIGAGYDKSLDRRFRRTVFFDSDVNRTLPAFQTGDKGIVDMGVNIRKRCTHPIGVLTIVLGVIS